jgi:hypothetical protein
MFTFKKIALLGVAGLAAFSMSCSDPADDAGGTLDGLKIEDSDEGIFLTGVITANEGVKVTKVEATADNKTVEVKGISGLPKSPVTLTGAYLSGVCGDSKDSKEYNIKITVTFDDESSISDSKKVSVNCGSAPPVTQGTFTLSLSGESYADVDESDTYKESALTSSVKALIDLAAYISNSAEDKIYSACYVSTIGPDDCEAPAIYNSRADLDADENEIEQGGLSISASGIFYLFSTEGDEFKVTITTANTSGKSVTLKAESL